MVDTVVSISRLTQDADNTDKESYVPNLALQSVKAGIQPASPEETAIADGVFAQTFTMYTTYSGVLVGDKVTTSGTGETYYVKGREQWDMDPLPHFELMLVRLVEDKV